MVSSWVGARISVAKGNVARQALAQIDGAYCDIHGSLKQAAEFSDGLPELSDEIDCAENPGKILSQTSDLCEIQKGGSGRLK